MWATQAHAWEAPEAQQSESTFSLLFVSLSHTQGPLRHLHVCGRNLHLCGRNTYNACDACAPTAPGSCTSWKSVGSRSSTPYKRYLQGVDNTPLSVHNTQGLACTVSRHTCMPAAAGSLHQQVAQLAGRRRGEGLLHDMRGTRVGGASAAGSHTAIAYLRGSKHGQTKTGGAAQMHTIASHCTGGC